MFCTAIERPNLENDARFATNAHRVEHINALDALINEALGTQSIAHWIALLSKHGIPAGPVLSIREALEHPQVSARNLLVSSSMHQGPHFQAVGPAFGIHQKDASPSSTAPKLGEDTRSILTEGGFTAAEIELFLNTKAAFAPLP